MSTTCCGSPKAPHTAATVQTNAPTATGTTFLVFLIEDGRRQRVTAGPELPIDRPVHTSGEPHHDRPTADIDLP